MKKIAIVLAGGSGKRMNSDIPKQYMQLLGKPVLYYSLSIFEKLVDEIVLVTGKDDCAMCKTNIIDRYGFNKVSKIVPGGKERFDSVMAGIAAINNECCDEDIVLIHDGARPCLAKDIVNRCIIDTLKYGSGVAAVPVKDTIKIVNDDGFAVSTPDRNTLWQIQTPQVFKYNIISSAYNKLKDDNNKGNITDDAMVVEQYLGEPVKLTTGAYYNIKITTPEDIGIAELYLKQNMSKQ